MNTLIEILDDKFTRIAVGWREVVHELNSDTLYRQLDPERSSVSCGEQVLRSARIVEQTFGGITANLWDDPFEWTLPETLTTPESVLDYLCEVEATRRRGFDLIRTEEDLTREIMTASGSTQLLSLLLDTLVRAGHHLLSAREVLKQLSSKKLPATQPAKING
jgi:hypothetical protein